MSDWDSFDVIPADAADIDRDAWTRLPQNGWGALVASLAGPQHARGVRRPAGSTTVAVRERGGAERRFSEPASQDDIDMVQNGIVDYLADHDVEPPPRGVEWEIRLPEGMTRRDLEREVNEAMLAVPDLDFKAENEAVARRLASILE